jgi:hypothetical protein
MGEYSKIQNYIHEGIKMKTSMQRWWNVTEK